MSKRSLDIVMPKLLKDRIKEFHIPPAPGQALFDEVLIFQIPDEEKGAETFGKESKIIKPMTKKDADEKRCPRGVIVSAGLGAMDKLRDHGMQLGEMVRFSPHVYTRFELDHDAQGREQYMPFMTVGDIKVSEDVPGRLVSGELELVYDNRKREYRYRRNGEETPEPDSMSKAERQSYIESELRRDPEVFDDSI